MFTKFGPSRPQWGAARILQIALAALLAAPAAQAQMLVMYDEHWPLNAVPQTLAEKAMGPQSGTALAIVNNRPFRYDTERYDDDVSVLEKAFSGDIVRISQFRDPGTSYRLTELLLLKSLKHAEQQRASWDVIGCHANLGMLYYQKADYLRSESHWREAARRAEGLENNDQRLAALYEFLGQTLRAQSKYQAAEEAYRKSLAIRLLVYGPRSHGTAAGWMNLAMLYNDWTHPEFEEHAIANAFAIMGPTAYFNGWLTQGPRPVSTFMPAKTTIAAELPDMASFAWGVLRRTSSDSRIAATHARRTGVAVVERHRVWR